MSKCTGGLEACKIAYNKSIDAEAATQLAASREPDFSPMVRIVHTGPAHPRAKARERLGKMMTVYVAQETYCARCVGSGRWKESFLLQCKGARWHEKVMKLTRLQWKSSDTSEQLDIEPQVFQKTRTENVTSRIYGSCIALDQHGVRYHCWLTEEAMSLSDIIRLGDVDCERVLTGYMYVLLKLCVKENLYLNDCSPANLGVRLNNFNPNTEKERLELIAIDAGHRDIVIPSRHHRSKTNAVMNALWRETEKLAPSATKAMRKQWNSTVDLDEFLLELHRRWQTKPWLTTHQRTAQEMKRALASSVPQSGDEQIRLAPCGQAEEDDADQSQSKKRRVRSPSESPEMGTQSRKANEDAERKRKEDLVALQCHMTRLGLYRYKVPQADEVERALGRALWKIKPCSESDTYHMELEAFEFLMEKIKTRIIDEYKAGPMDVD